MNLARRGYTDNLENFFLVEVLANEQCVRAYVCTGVSRTL